MQATLHQELHTEECCYPDLWQMTSEDDQSLWAVLPIHAVLSQLICYNASSLKVSSEGPHPTWAKSDKIIVLHTLMLMF